MAKPQVLKIKYKIKIFVLDYYKYVYSIRWKHLIFQFCVTSVNKLNSFLRLKNNIAKLLMKHLKYSYWETSHLLVLRQCTFWTGIKNVIKNLNFVTSYIKCKCKACFGFNFFASHGWLILLVFSWISNICQVILIVEILKHYRFSFLYNLTLYKL